MKYGSLCPRAPTRAGCAKPWNGWLPGSAALLKKTNLEYNGNFRGSITLVTLPGNLKRKTELDCH